MGYTMETFTPQGSVVCSMPLEPTQELVERFMEKVDIGCKGECWEWEGATMSQGYGSINKHGGGGELAHRFMMKLCGNPISESQVNHTCDNRLCVNPTHLYVGTQADNMDDAVSRDRFPTGKDHHNTKLTGGEVKEIREKHDGGGVTMASLGREYNVDTKTISDIVNRETWRHVE